MLPKLTEIAAHGLIEVQDTMVINPATDKKRPQPAPAVTKLQSTAKIMRILIGEQDRWQDKPLHQALVEALRANDIAGVTVYRGILGYGANRRMHKDSALNLSHDAPIAADRRRHGREAARILSGARSDGEAGTGGAVGCRGHQVFARRPAAGDRGEAK